MEQCYPYQNPSLSAEERADDLLARMSPEEKLGQIQCCQLMGGDLATENPCGVGQISALFASAYPDKVSIAQTIRARQEAVMALSEHHIPAMFHIETLTGVLMPNAQTYPCGIAQGAAWDPQAQEALGRGVATQARAIGIRQGLAPVFDIARDPRFGRIGETYGEDPTLAAALGSAVVRGMQHNGDLKEGIVATSKHFLAFQAGEGGIHAAPTAVPPRRLREVYAKPFQAAITESGLASVMNSYASLDGDAVVGSKAILTDLLRGEMKFDGFTVSDYSSVEQLHSVHHTCETVADAGQCAMEAGMDAELPVVQSYNKEMLARFTSGQADIAVLDQAVRRQLIAKFRLGLFEHPFPMEGDTLEETFASGANHELSKRLAHECIVLLQNNGVLPLDPDALAGKTVAVVGYHADSLCALFGGYSYPAMKENSLGVRITMAGIELDGPVPEKGRGETWPGSIVNTENAGVAPLMREAVPHAKPLLEALRAACPETNFIHAVAYPYVGTDESGFAEAFAAIEKADLVICTIGGRYGWNTASTVGEGIDATNIGLPPCQEAFLSQLKACGKPAIGVHFDARPLSSTNAAETLDAILEVWSPAEEGAPAIADVLTGAYNPSGKLPVTAARSAGQLPIYYAHEPSASYSAGGSIGFDSYMDSTRRPLYCFGHGLSYTSFTYRDLVVNTPVVAAADEIRLSVTIENSGEMAGEEVVQLYLHDEFASMARPVKELEGFCRVALAPGEAKKITFRLPASQLAFLDSAMRWKVEKGVFDVLVGASSEDIRLNDTFIVKDDAFVDGATRGFYAKADIT